MTTNDIRTMADEVGRARGRPILIATHVPDSTEYARAIGLDLARWLADDLLELRRRQDARLDGGLQLGGQRLAIGRQVGEARWLDGADVVRQAGVANPVAPGRRPISFAAAGAGAGAAGRAAAACRARSKRAGWRHQTAAAVKPPGVVFRHAVGKVLRGEHLSFQH